jgi:hypothetical protein
MNLVWGGIEPTPRADGGTPYVWRVYLCSSCGSAVTSKSDFLTLDYQNIIDTYPKVREPHISIPERARNYLLQAYESLGTPDGAVMLASSSIDAMLKHKGYQDGTLYERIEEAARNHLITDEMKLWAHEVRMQGNKPRHADIEDPHATTHEAEKVIQFADALANYLFVIPSLVERGRQKP